MVEGFQIYIPKNFCLESIFWKPTPLRATINNWVPWKDTVISSNFPVSTGLTGSTLIDNKMKGV